MTNPLFPLKPGNLNDVIDNLIHGEYQPTTPANKEEYEKEKTEINRRYNGLERVCFIPIMLGLPGFCMSVGIGLGASITNQSDNPKSTTGYYVAAAGSALSVFAIVLGLVISAKYDKKRKDELRQLEEKYHV